eukprot:484393_1
MVIIHDLSFGQIAQLNDVRGTIWYRNGIQMAKYLPLASDLNTNQRGTIRQFFNEYKRALFSKNTRRTMEVSGEINMMFSIWIVLSLGSTTAVVISSCKMMDQMDNACNIISNMTGMCSNQP